MKRCLKGKSYKEATVKLNICKAYDRIERNFFKGIMERFVFDRMWVNLVLNCVTSMSNSLLVNGDQIECSKPLRD